MARNLDQKCKQCRREGIKLFLKGERCLSQKCAIVKRNYPPGLHGAKGRNKTTSYGIQLREKQRAKRYYGLLEKQFRLYYEKAAVKRENTMEALLHLLELRLDNVIFRLGLAQSHQQARQLVSHGHILVNGKKVTIPSYQAQPGDTIEVRASSKTMPYFEKTKASLIKHEAPTWISLEKKDMKAKILDLPTVEQVAAIFDLRHIIEFYSR